MWEGFTTVRALTAGVAAVAVLSTACGGGGSPAEAKAKTCFEALSKGDTKTATDCVDPERRERYSDQVSKLAGWMKGCHEQVSGAESKPTKDDQAQVLLKFKAACGEPPSDANGRKVMGMGVGLQKKGNDWWVINYERVAQ